MPRMKALKIGDQEVMVVGMWNCSGLPGSSLPSVNDDDRRGGSGVEPRKPRRAVDVGEGRLCARDDPNHRGDDVLEPRTRAGQDHALDRDRQLDRPPRAPVGWQAVERNGRRGHRGRRSTVPESGALERETLHVIAFHEVEKCCEAGRQRPSSCSAACTASSRPAPRHVPPRRSPAESDGPVLYDADKCIGCRYCQLARPWDVPPRNGTH